jgi:RHS repeat-associated protein
MERDEESGLNYHGARYYAPWLGRWVSSDPIGIAVGPNLYAYVLNNPVRLHDRLGMQPDPDINLPQDAQGNYLVPGEAIEVTGTHPNRDWAALQRLVDRGVIDAPTWAEHKRQLLFKCKQNPRECELSMEPVEQWYWEEFPEEAQAEYEAKLGAAIDQSYSRIVSKKLAEWEKSSRRMDAAAKGTNQLLGFLVAGTAGAVGVGTAGVVGFGKQLVFGGILAGSTSSGDSSGCGMLASVGGGALPRSAPTPIAPGGIIDEVDAAFASGQVRSGTMVRFSDKGGPLTGSGPKQGTGAIWYHDNIKIPGSGPGGAKVELRTHSPNPNAPTGSYSRSNYTTQINTTDGRYLLPDGSWKTIPSMTEAERAAAHYPAGN